MQFDATKELFGYIGVICSLSAYVLYVKDVFVHNTRPHAFSWLVWGVLGAIAFAAQRWGEAGAGSWITGTDMIMCFVIVGLALWRGEKGYTRFDWAALALSGVSLWLWHVTKEPTWSVILITLVDFFAFLPTFRKSYYRPWEESMSMYVLSIAKYSAALVATASYSIATSFYIASIIPMNLALIGMVCWRRRVRKTA